MNTNRVEFIVFRVACLVGFLSFAFFAHSQGVETEKSERIKEAKGIHKHKTVTSKDGTKIAYDIQGKGPAVILVGGALATRSGASELAQLLAPHFKVYSYDRRGRGDSTDTKPYSVRREIEDLEALIDEAGGSAYVYGKSSGAALALEATRSLGKKVKKLAIYEAPYSDAEGAAQEWKEFRSRLDALLTANRPADAITLFMKFVGAPDETIAEMKASPAWPGMVTMAPTLAYDNAVVGEDRSVPVDVVAGIKVNTLVMDGGASVTTMPFMRPSADKLASVIPGAQRLTVEGQGHDVSSQALAPILAQFFLK
jgi:pimeloyl-ACP methyl ester carboxylesterase